MRVEESGGVGRATARSGACSRSAAAGGEAPRELWEVMVASG